MRDAIVREMAGLRFRLFFVEEVSLNSRYLIMSQWVTQKTEIARNRSPRALLLVKP